MSTAAPHRPLLPPGQEAPARSLAMALGAHGLLVWALAIGVNWRSAPELGVAEAELWARVPQLAAPPAPAPTPAPAPPPAPAPEPSPRAQPQAERDAEIAVQKERKQRERERQQAELREREKERLRERDKERERDKALEKQREAQTARADEARREALRQENLRRMQQGLSGGTGSPSSTGTSSQSAGPSSGYAGRIMARIRPNITFTEPVSSRLTAEVEMRCAPDGLIVARRIVKSSGNSRYDEAVLRAIDKTERIPRDTDGRVPSVIPVIFNSSE